MTANEVISVLITLLGVADPVWSAVRRTEGTRLRLKGNSAMLMGNKDQIITGGGP